MPEWTAINKPRNKNCSHHFIKKSNEFIHMLEHFIIWITIINNPVAIFTHFLSILVMVSRIILFRVYCFAKKFKKHLLPPASER